MPKFKPRFSRTLQLKIGKIAASHKPLDQTNRIYNSPYPDKDPDGELADRSKKWVLANLFRPRGRLAENIGEKNRRGPPREHCNLKGYASFGTDLFQAHIKRFLHFSTRTQGKHWQDG